MIVGGSPTAGYLLLLRQKKVTQEKATPFRRPFGVPCVARQAGRLRNSALRASDSPRRLPPARLCYSAVERGNPNGNFNTEPPVRALPGQTKNTATRFARDCTFSGVPFCAASVCRSNWDEGEHCSSSAAACVLCKLLGRVAQPPNLAGKPKEPRRGGAAGCPSLGLLSLGQTRESD